jgi:hypothetical protein
MNRMTGSRFDDAILKKVTARLLGLASEHPGSKPCKVDKGLWSLADDMACPGIASQPCRLAM